jgi:hypothetical protein
MIQIPLTKMQLHCNVFPSSLLFFSPSRRFSLSLSLSLSMNVIAVHFAFLKIYVTFIVYSEAEKQQQKQ